MNTDIIARKDLWYLSVSIHLNNASENSSSLSEVDSALFIRSASLKDDFLRCI